LDADPVCLSCFLPFFFLALPADAVLILFSLPLVFLPHLNVPPLLSRPDFWTFLNLHSLGMNLPPFSMVVPCIPPKKARSWAGFFNLPFWVFPEVRISFSRSFPQCSDVRRWFFNLFFFSSFFSATPPTFSGLFAPRHSYIRIGFLPFSIPLFPLFPGFLRYSRSFFLPKCTPFRFFPCPISWTLFSSSDRLIFFF